MAFLIGMMTEKKISALFTVNDNLWDTNNISTKNIAILDYDQSHKRITMFLKQNNVQCGSRNLKRKEKLPTTWEREHFCRIWVSHPRFERILRQVVWLDRLQS